MLRKYEDFHWTEQREEALLQLKKYLSRPPLLLKQTPRKTRYVYLSITEHVVNGVLVREDSTQPMLIYYVNNNLVDA